MKNLKMESETKTPAKIFGSKVLRSEPKRSEKKNLIWDYFIQSDKDLSKAHCNLCGGVYSMGSDKPKLHWLNTTSQSQVLQHLQTWSVCFQLAATFLVRRETDCCHVMLSISYLSMKTLLMFNMNTDTNPSDEHGQTPLHFAAFKGHLDIYKLLLLNY
ncbi:MAG: hypothetical protein GY694_02695 [Gammaproteobacteria bacterium]|nr:hypothetical protein [Gammaproteobacteria bacterium]